MVGGLAASANDASPRRRSRLPATACSALLMLRLDVAERHRRPLRQRHRQLVRRRLDLGVGHHLGHDAERVGLLRRQHRRRQIELARLGAAEHLGEEVGAAVIAGQPDLGEGRGDLGGGAGDAQIAGQRDRQAGAGGGAVDLRHHGLRHLVQDARDFHAAAQIGHLGLERQRRPPLRHRLDVAADAERAAGALQQHRAHLVILRRPPRRLDQPARHVRIERVAPVRPVHGDGEQAVVEILQDDFVWLMWSCFRCCC